MIKIGLFCAIALMALGSMARAQSAGLALGGFSGADPNAPVEVSADALEVDQTGGTARFIGDVLVIQGGLRLAAPLMVVAYVRNADGSVGSGVDTITASGGVTVVTPQEAAEAQTAVYSPLDESLEMSGDVLLTQGDNTLSGARLIVDLATGTGRMDGRVRTILTPAASEPQ